MFYKLLINIPPEADKFNMEESKNYLIILPIVLLVIGLVVGYFFGVKVGDKQGRAALLAEQEAAAEKALEEAKEAANPFSKEDQTVNPFKEDYQNPFSGTNNPFSQ